MSEQNKAVVLKFIEAMGKGDAKAAAPCIAEDTYTLAKGFGKFAGVRTHDLILATIDAFHNLMPGGMEPDIISVTGEGDRVVVEFEGNGTLVNGESYGNQYCMVFTLRDGKIRQVNEYFCTILADEKLWPLVSQMSELTNGA
ncbi:nuclear transport factor 2 family protein [Halioxenophilus sp. WMMB6]|uniref:nuclear transport factor 2 family protein n=1 Tax=Halioxenophilus sp. WMMB6 TaxID=3073815 RepID=UPI00295EEAA5|nr:nuclear transport factor 2 family protein [Halioxenophilus sp. WMMB6]